MTMVYETANFKVLVDAYSADRVLFMVRSKRSATYSHSIFGWKQPRARLPWWRLMFTYDGEERLAVIAAASAAIEDCDRRERNLIESRTLAAEGERLAVALGEVQRVTG